MTSARLVQPLFEGPVDVVADAHGEIEALQGLLAHLGYRNGVHRQGRRLVFLGDLTDRGPDSPAVVELVSWLVDLGLAQCVLGNHDLNILLEEHKADNHWYFGEAERLGHEQVLVRQHLADGLIRDRVRQFFKSLPLVLHRPDLRIVHACWHDDAVRQLEGEYDTVAAYHAHRGRIEAELNRFRISDPVERELRHQNDNPVKVLTSGLEQWAAQAYADQSGKRRDLERTPWWEGYRDGPLVLVGHYGKKRLPGEQADSELFDERNHHRAMGPGRAFCIDFSIARRWLERHRVGEHGPFHTRLAAFRFPERELLFEDGSRVKADVRA